MSAAAPFPTGTVTFLFTDIEGSTSLLQRLGTATWSGLLERHHALVREAIAADGGREIGTEGDAFFVVFTSAPAAVRAVVAVQRRLAAEPWPDGCPVRVRMGLHTGEGTLGADGDYVGLDVHRAARIASAAHGGQVLLSGTTQALGDGSLPPHVSLLDLGEHRLKDLSRPERLVQLVIEGLPARFPPVRTIDATPGNLPVLATSFVGRRREVAEGRALLESTRLLTLTGPGGTGKTRLALRLASESIEAFPDGVFFVALEPITDPGLIAPTIARVVGVQDVGGEPVEKRLLDFLAPRRILLVLDNFEQVIAGAPIVAQLLAGAPGLTVVATSRASLRVSGEQEFPVPPLGVPDPAHLPPPDALAQYEAVALFVARAMAARPDFTVTSANASAVAQITARLDGLPLAIELAAARIRMLTPEAMLPRLESRLALLGGGSRDLPARQQTLRGAIDWSHGLLDDPGRCLFARLSTFVGGFALEAAEAVCGPSTEGRPDLDVFGGLSELVDQSLVRRMEDHSHDRFRMLETIREFAAERLSENGEGPEMRRRHAAYFTELAERAEPYLVGEDRARWLDVLEHEHDNLRAAIGWAVEAGDTEMASRLVASLWRFWQSRAFLGEGAMRVETVLAMPAEDLDPSLRMRVLDAAGGLAYWMGDMERAKDAYEESLALARRGGDRGRLAEALYNVSFTYVMPRSDMDGGQRVLEEAAGIYRELGDDAGLVNALWGLGNVHHFDQRWEAARDAYLEALELARRTGNRFMVGWALHMAASAELKLGRYRDAHEHFSEAARRMIDDRETTGIVLSLDGFSELANVVGDIPRSLVLSGAARKLQDDTGTGLAAFSLQLMRRGTLSTGDMDPQEIERLRAEGRSLSIDEAVALALATPVPAGD